MNRHRFCINPKNLKIEFDNLKNISEEIIAFIIGPIHKEIFKILLTEKIIKEPVKIRPFFNGITYISRNNFLIKVYFFDVSKYKPYMVAREIHFEGDREKIEKIKRKLPPFFKEGFERFFAEAKRELEEEIEREKRFFFSEEVLKFYKIEKALLLQISNIK